LRDFIASFRSVCLDPPVEMRRIVEYLDRLKLLIAAAEEPDRKIRGSHYCHLCY